MNPMVDDDRIRATACPSGGQLIRISESYYANALNSKLIPLSRTKLIHRSPEIHKGKSTIYFTINEEVELTKDCKFILIGKFSHGRPSVEDIRSDFAARFTLKGQTEQPHFRAIVEESWQEIVHGNSEVENS